jgi:thioredoxin-related protein
MTDAPSQSPPPADTAPQPRRGKSPWWWQAFWLTFLVVSLAYAWYSFYVPANDIAWAADYAAAQQQAAQTGKPVILFFTGKWCVPCRIMKRTVWADDRVEATVNASFIPVLIDVDDPAAAAATTRYNIGATPTTIVTDAEGNVLQRVEGGINKSDFLKLLAQPNPSAAADSPTHLPQPRIEHPHPLPQSLALVHKLQVPRMRLVSILVLGCLENQV